MKMNCIISGGPQDGAVAELELTEFKIPLSDVLKQMHFLEFGTDKYKITRSDLKTQTIWVEYLHEVPGS